ncbi:MAG TPA: hypothetical protein PKM58_10440 [Pyrinomonadaceae bacterium]|nr:hypothetical protein [Pyrinomonadaceae bacterium]
MKLIIVRFDVESGEALVPVPIGPRFGVKVTCPPRQVDCDVTLKSSEHSWKFSGLAWHEIDIDNPTDCASACLGFIFAEPRPQRFLILGIDRLIAVDDRLGAKEALALNRFLNEDRGWLFFKGLNVSNGIIINYENGVFFVTDDCALRWHMNLMRDDVFVRVDDSFLYFWSEFRTPQDFRIEINSGEIRDGV